MEYSTHKKHTSSLFKSEGLEPFLGGTDDAKVISNEYIDTQSMPGAAEFHDTIRSLTLKESNTSRQVHDIIDSNYVSQDADNKRAYQNVMNTDESNNNLNVNKI